MAELALGPVDPQPVLEEVLQTLQPHIAAAQAEVQLQGPFPTLTANRLVLSQALQNLLSNALKFTARGQSPQVSVGCDERGRLSVCDRGIGIPEEYKQRIFKVFERLHGGETYPGTGIGLAIVARAAERMNGSFGVDSTEGEGSCFWIELPPWSQT